MDDDDSVDGSVSLDTTSLPAVTLNNTLLPDAVGATASQTIVTPSLTSSLPSVNPVATGGSTSGGFLSFLTNPSTVGNSLTGVINAMHPTVNLSKQTQTGLVGNLMKSIQGLLIPLAVVVVVIVMLKSSRK